MFAIFEDGSRQYKVSEGDIIEVDNRPVDEGGHLQFDDVLLYSSEEDLRIGKPVLDDVAVKATVQKKTKGDKVVIMKFKRRKGYKKKTGHRQKYIQVKIDEISVKK